MFIVPEPSILLLVITIAFFYLLHKSEFSLSRDKKAELKDIIARKKRGETIYLDDLKYLTKEDLRKHLNAKFHIER